MTEAIPTRRRRSLYSISAAAFRWVHIYVSMLGFATLMFFAVTGITLNHPAWFGASEQTMRDLEGTLPSRFLTESDGSVDYDELGIAEWLRAEHRLRGSVTEFSADEFEIMVVFKGPGYAADVFIDPANGSYTAMELASGVVAIMNDLHKGRDSGAEWSWVIDISAVVTILLSVSGFGLLLYVKRRRRSGILTAVAGTVVLVAAWAMWVP